MLRQASRSLIAAVLLFASAWAWADAVTDRARSLLQRNDPVAAYKLLQPLEPQRAGDPEFDYLLGIAALDAGDPERAIFALERVLAVQPDNLQARAEIGRAYLATGEREAARREFEAVRARQVPPQVRSTIDGYLSAIAAAEQTQVTSYLDVWAGYDSNVNSATPSSTIAIPAIGPVFTLAPSLLETSDQFINVALGTYFTRKLDHSWSLVGSLGGVLRRNFSASLFDTDTVDGSLGVRFARGLDAITIGLQGQYFGVGSSAYRTTGGGVAQWQHNFDERTQVTVFGQYAALRYDTQPVRDADRSIGGVAFGKTFIGAYAPTIFLSVYGGQEKELDEAYPHLGHTPVGVRLGGQLRLGGGYSAYGSLAYEQREYGGPDPLFLVTREDKQTDVILGLSYLWRPGVTFRLQTWYTDNSSNIVLNDYDRTETSLAVRFNF
ncbi:MAG: tetratricopeptide repeat protein [Betaproteobacteria bacterium]|nr:tetratricopeptide repeat protein [Betaproteobacteria bacterium]